jgi:predicted DNA-binding protein (MmcQ/YjbR family)
MNAENLRTFCLSLPHVTEDIKWGHDLCFLIAEKMFTVTGLESAEGHNVAFKCTPERFAELIEIEGIIPAPYMARNHWVSLRRPDALRDAEIKELIRTSYELVVAKLPKRVQDGLKAKAAPKTGKKKRVKPMRSSSR